jgi:hypothetical protein
MRRKLFDCPDNSNAHVHLYFGDVFIMLMLNHIVYAFNEGAIRRYKRQWRYFGKTEQLQDCHDRCERAMELQQTAYRD